MVPFLKNHPFAVDAFFESSIVLTFALPKEQLADRIPPCLTLDTFDDKWAFVAVALVQTRDLRPKGFPRFLGNDFFLIGYRIFVRYTNAQTRRLRGLYLLRSETDRRRMEILGNTFTHYNYTTTDIFFQTRGSRTSVWSARSGLDIVVDAAGPDIPLPAGSPFPDWHEARRYAGPLPFTFTYNQDSKMVTIIEGVRQNWQPSPLHVLQHRVDVLDQLGLSSPVLANAFVVNKIPYRWKKGKLEKWTGGNFKG